MNAQDRDRREALDHGHHSPFEPVAGCSRCQAPSAASTDDRYEITVRHSTPQERREFPPPLGGSRRVRVPKYVVVGVESGNIVTVFGLPQGGDTRAEAVFWAERAESKNDLRFTRPDGWDHVEGKLP